MTAAERSVADQRGSGAPAASGPDRPASQGVEPTDGVIALRPIRIEDAEVYVRLQDDEITARFEWDRPASLGDLESAIRRWAERWEAGGDEHNFAIVLAETGEMIGDCEAELRDDGLVNLMYVVFGPWRRQGHASRAARLLIAHARTVFPGAPSVLRIHPDNVASLGVARTIGAELDGIEPSRSGRPLERWILHPESDPPSGR
jgi:RimJ/RimL family protein N-acetyltransferase